MLKPIRMDDIESLTAAITLIDEYYGIRRRQIFLTKEIGKDSPNDTQPGEWGFASNHLHDYFDADRQDRTTDAGGMDFDEYCCDVLGMEEPCPACAKVLEMIRERRQLNVKLGVTKNKIMRLGAKLNKPHGDTIAP